MKAKAARIFLAFLSLGPGLLLPAQERREEPIVYAEHKTIGEDALRATGHVEVLWQDTVIHADAIDFDLRSRELFAEGRVTMAAGDMVLSGEKLVFNLKTHRGEMRDAFGMASPVVRFHADGLQQTDRDTLVFQRLDFSSCAQIAPRWSLRSRRGRIKKEQYIEMHGALLRIKSVPVFYLPYLRYPLPRDGRSTGFLFPGIGSSGLRGFFVQNAFFWALKPNLDMTLGLDYFSKLGVGASDEVRYLFRDAQGSARVYYFRYRPGNQVYQAPGDDYFVEAEHRQRLPFLNTRLRLNVNLQSRPDFLRLFDTHFDMARRANFPSEASLTSSFANVQATVGVSRRETYYVTRNKSLVLESIPSLALNLNQQRLGPLPGYFSLAADFQRTRRSGESFEEDPQFVTGLFSQRLTLAPSYRLALVRLPWLNGSLNLGAQRTFYAKSWDAETGTAVDKPVSVSYQTAQLSMQGPIFSRVFAAGAGRLKHVVEPEIVFFYASEASNTDRLLKVDRSDFPSTSKISLRLTSRLLAKGSGAAASPREVLSYSLSQEYFFDPAAANFNLMIDGEYPRFSKLSQALRLRPAESLTLDAVADYNHYLRDLTLLNLRAAYNRPGSPLTGTLSYSIYRNPYQAKDFDLNQRLLTTGLHFDLAGFPLKLDGRLDYSFSEKPGKRLLHGSLDAGFDYQCLFFHLQFKTFTWLGKSHPQFRIGVSLWQLGMAGDFFGGN